jgi:hypothetical protein
MCEEMEAHINHLADKQVLVFVSEALVPTSSWVGGIGHPMISVAIPRRDRSGMSSPLSGT